MSPATLKRKTPLRKKRKGSKRPEADRLFSLAIRERDGECQYLDLGWATSAPSNRLPCSGALQCAHLISRRYGAVRYDERNAVALCQAHHMYWTHRPLEWTRWCESRLGESRWRALQDVALHSPPMDPAAVIQRYRSAT